MTEGSNRWRRQAEREKARHADGLARLPAEPGARQRQLVRVANAALGAGLAHLMAGDRAEASTWLSRAADHYRASHAGAPPGSWGRPIGAVKCRLLAGDPAGAEQDARWALELGAGSAESAIGRYAAVLALLVLGRDGEAARLARSLLEEPAETFPPEVAGALLGLAECDAGRYTSGLEGTLRSFETREAYLEDVPVADTVLVLEALAARRGLEVRPSSALLP